MKIIENFTKHLFTYIQLSEYINILIVLFSSRLPSNLFPGKLTLYILSVNCPKV